MKICLCIYVRIGDEHSESLTSTNRGLCSASLQLQLMKFKSYITQGNHLGLKRRKKLLGKPLAMYPVVTTNLFLAGKIFGSYQFFSQIVTNCINFRFCFVLFLVVLECYNCD